MKGLTIALCASLGIALSASEARAESGKKLGSLESAVRQVVERQLPDALHLLDLDVPSAMKRRYPRYRHVSLRWRSAPKKGRTLVQLSLRSKRGKVRKSWARLELVEMGEVLVPTVDLRAGQEIEPGQLIAERKPLRTGDEVQLTPSSLVGSAVLADVRAGQPLLRSKVELPMPLSRGSSVKVIVRMGRIEVATTGQLESRSVPGEVVRVRVAGRVLRGRLGARKTVLLQEEL